MPPRLLASPLKRAAKAAPDAVKAAGGSSSDGARAADVAAAKVAAATGDSPEEAAKTAFDAIT